jgi:hypothetical protein
MPYPTGTESRPAYPYIGQFFDRGGAVFNVMHPDFGAIGDGVADDTAALNAAHTALGASGGIIYFPPGIYRFTSKVTFTKRCLLLGSALTASTGVAERGPVVLLKDGNFDGIELAGEGSVMQGIQVDGETGNGGDGVIVGSGRIALRDVTVTSQGNDGIRIGDDDGTNCNLWRLSNCVCVGNTGHGLYIHQETDAVPDTNAGLVLGYDGRSNGGDGIRINNSFDNIFHGVTVQSNTGYGVHVLGTASRPAKGHIFWFPYAELNVAGEILFAANSQECVGFGYRSGLTNDDYVADAGTNNMILGHHGSVVGGRLFRTVLGMTTARINSPSISGYWDFRQNAADRNLEVELGGTTATNVLFDLMSDLGSVDGYAIEGTKVVGVQGASVADASGGSVIDVEARAALNDLLARVRAHGLIAT